MSEFLTLLPPQKALDIFMQALPPKHIRNEKVTLLDAIGRITAEKTTASEALPSFSRSSVDGYAVRAVDTFGASDSLPAYLKVAGEVPMGDAPNFSITAGYAAKIHTGGMLPTGSDAVVMVELTQESQPGEIEIHKSVAAAENVILCGEDVKMGDVVIKKGKLLRPAEIGGLAALGIMSIEVMKKPVVGIISSGDEVVQPEYQLKPGQVRDVNTYTLAALVDKSGGIAVPQGIIPDRWEDLQQAATKALQNSDIVVITAGSSASTRDLTAKVIQSLGEPGVLVHGISIRPGKPTILGVCNGKAVIGLPGNPVSALVVAGLFVVPVITHLLGIKQSQIPRTITARLAVNLPSQTGREDYIPVKLLEINGQWWAEPIFFKSNLIFSLVNADALICIPADANGLPNGAFVEAILL